MGLRERALGVGVALLAASLCACSSDPDPPPLAGAPSCPELEPEAPITLDADVRVIASAQSEPPYITQLARQLIIDNQDVYWSDGNGSVFVERADERRVVELKHGDTPESATRRQMVHSIVAGTDRLYAGDGFLRTDVIDGDPYFEPPGRLLSISKQDGNTTVLLQLNDRTLTPIAADADRVIVFAAGYDESTDSYDSGYYQVHLADLQLERLPLAAPFQSSQLVGNTVYWLNGAHPRSLVRSGFDDAEPESVLELSEDYFFAVTHLNTPGFTPALDVRILRQDDARIFLRSQGTLIALQKP